MIKISIKPLSVNEAFQGRRFKTDKYKAFEKEFKIKLPICRNFNFTGKLRVNIRYGFSSSLSDLDNGCKQTLDCLCKHYGFDDRQIYQLYQEKTIVKKGEEFIEFEIAKL